MSRNIRGPGLLKLRIPRPRPGLRGLLALYLKDAYLVPLHPYYRVPPSLRRLFSQLISRFLAGTQGFFALPEGYPHRLAGVGVTQSNHALEALHLPCSWQDLLPDLAQQFVYGRRGTLKGT